MFSFFGNEARYGGTVLEASSRYRFLSEKAPMEPVPVDVFFGGQYQLLGEIPPMQPVPVSVNCIVVRCFLVFVVLCLKDFSLSLKKLFAYGALGLKTFSPAARLICEVF